MEFTDGHIILRPYTLEDVDALYDAAIESVETVSPWLPWCRQDYRREESEEWIRAQIENWDQVRDIGFAIFDREGKRYLGGCGLNEIRTDRRYANLGYWVRKSEEGKGIATRAARLIGRIGAEQFQICRIEIVAAVGNFGSQRVAEKAGAFREGIIRNRVLLDGKLHSAVLYSFIPADFGLSGWNEHRPNVAEPAYVESASNGETTAPKSS
jgi:RimJ/RimL family protein N-acetyltransferase